MLQLQPQLRQLVSPYYSDAPTFCPFVPLPLTSEPESSRRLWFPMVRLGSLRGSVGSFFFFFLLQIHSYHLLLTSHGERVPPKNAALLSLRGPTLTGPMSRCAPWPAAMTCVTQKCGWWLLSNLCHIMLFEPWWCCGVDC